MPLISIVGGIDVEIYTQISECGFYCGGDTARQKLVTYRLSDTDSPLVKASHGLMNALEIRIKNSVNT